MVYVTDCSLGNSRMGLLLCELTLPCSLAIRVMLLTLCPTLQRQISRDILVGGVDGVVLILDSRAGVFASNLRAVREVNEALALADARKKGSTPVVLQYNRRDAEDRLPLRYLQSQANSKGHPWVAATAAEGKGVLTTFRMIMSMVVKVRESRAAIPMELDP